MCIYLAKVNSNLISVTLKYNNVNFIFICDVKKSAALSVKYIQRHIITITDRTFMLPWTSKK
jgi:sensor domain CHASE-containing protein